MRKITKILLLFGIITLVTFSCVEEDEPPCACGVENPQENLEWLYILLQSKIISDSGIITEIYSIMYQEEEYIGIYISGSLSHRYNYYYDCSGNEICMYSGYDGDWTCEEDFKNATNDKKLIYKIKND